MAFDHACPIPYITDSKSMLYYKKMPTINKKTCKEKTYHMPSDSAEYYNSKYWKELRNRYIRQHPLCKMCAMEGRSVPAEHVHHVVPFMQGKTKKERWSLLLNYNNLMSLCRECHQKIHREMKHEKDAVLTEKDAVFSASETLE